MVDEPMLSAKDHQVPCVVVLMATHNGAHWIDAQIDSILSQRGVDVRLVIHDDASTDGTREHLANRWRDPRVTLLPAAGRIGSAAGNFLFLIKGLPYGGVEPAAVALADQDDVWHSDKLEKALHAMADHQADAVSTNVTAVWEDGRKKRLNKAQAQRLWDHFFESAGPGCTYVMRGDLISVFSRTVAQDPRLAAVAFHDWLLYAWVRTQGKTWWIDPIPRMDYRQHAHNVFGANIGWTKAIRRLRMLFNGWYFHQVTLLARLCEQDQHPVAQRLLRDRWTDRLKLVSDVRHCRRKWSERPVLAIALLLARRNPR